MFEAMLWLAAAICAVGVVAAFDGSRDVFHPLMFLGPMLAFLYSWMPSKLLAADGLARYFDNDQLVFVQGLNLLGLGAFVGACLAAGVRLRRPITTPNHASSGFGHARMSPEACRRLLIGGMASGLVGLTCWLITIHNVGGFVNAFSTSYAGGWDDNGYVRDGSLLLLVGVLLAVTALAKGGPRWWCLGTAAVFAAPWTAQAVLMARRGPTFAIVVVVLMSWYLNRRERPPVLLVGVVGVALGWLVLFLVTNRGSIYLGSNFDVTTDVSDIVEKPDTGNEYIYGTGSVLAAERRDHYFWMRRYLAQVLVRPIPSAVWPTKYEDFGVPELLENAGTGEGFADALGWVGANGSAPGIVADLWVEVSWGCLVLLALLGWMYGRVWRRAVTEGGPWASQYVVLAALSIYLVMQTMEAVIFRSLLLSIPCWISWRWAYRAPVRDWSGVRPALPMRRPAVGTRAGVRVGAGAAAATATPFEGVPRRA